MRIIAFITEAAPVEQILLALGEPPRPPPITPARPCAALWTLRVAWISYPLSVRIRIRWSIQTQPL